MNEDELARIIVEVLHRKLDVSHNNLLATEGSYHCVCVVSRHVRCISHFLDSVDEKSNTPILSPFMSSWNLIFTTSMRARRVWIQLTGRGMRRYNSTRWWSLWECAMVVFREWSFGGTFLHSWPTVKSLPRKADRSSPKLQLKTR